MNITGVCPYETPCGWCSKWDKKCDKAIGNQDMSLSPCWSCVHLRVAGMLTCEKCNKENGWMYYIKDVKEE